MDFIHQDVVTESWLAYLEGPRPGPQSKVGWGSMLRRGLSVVSVTQGRALILR